MTTNRCSLNCSYCVPAGTKIVDSNFDMVNIEDLNEGDSVLGFDEFSSGIKQRKTKKATITKTFKRRAKVVEITTESGKNIRITKNHPILGDRVSKTGWKNAGDYWKGQKVYVTNIPEFPSGETGSLNYKKGYVVGMILGDGSIKKYIDKNGYDMHKIRLAVKDDEIIDRTEVYLDEIGIDLYRKKFLVSKKYNLLNDALFGNRRDIYNSFKELIGAHFQKNISEDYCRGFLAGIYDAEGSIGKTGSAIRIFNFDEKILDEIRRCLGVFDFEYTTESNGVRILSNKKHEPLRFVKLVSPACTRKREERFLGRYDFTRERIVSISEVDSEMDVYNIETTSSTYFANGIAVHNCYESEREGDISTDTAKAAVDWLRSEGRNGRWKHITFFGGEPLLRPKLIRETIEYALETNDPIDKFSILSNGTIWNEEVKETLQYMRSHCPQSVLQISVDGQKESHDKYRKFHDGRGSFDTIMENIVHFKKIFPSLIFRQTVCPDNVSDLAQDFKMMFDLSGPEGNVSLTPIVEGGWTKEIVEEYNGQLVEILDVYRKSDKNTFFNLIHGTKDRLCYEEARALRGCSAGRNLACVSVEGYIYPCHRFCSYRDIYDSKIGDVWAGVDRECSAYKDVVNAFGSNEKCNGCSATICNACMATNIALGNGLDFNPPEGYCQMALSGGDILEDATIEFVRNNKVQLGYGEVLKLGTGGFCKMEDEKNTEFVDNIDLLAQGMLSIMRQLRDLKIDMQKLKEAQGIKCDHPEGGSDECSAN